MRKPDRFFVLASLKTGRGAPVMEWGKRLRIAVGSARGLTYRIMLFDVLNSKARPLLVQALETGNIDELVDPRLENYYNRDEMFRMIEAAAACVRHSAPKRPRMIQVLRALDNDAAHAMDLTNGVKVGQSTTFDANQSSASELQRFRQMVLSIEEEPCEDGDASNRPMTRSVEPNSSVRGVSRR